ncbi:MAG: hypothetical protein KatS3mg005_4162 [Bryobacteraceae bacterium]|nr:MAG: hypothetical protein KatS3mg005_4162 [Bryobacteraceae bacterium]
MKDVLKWGLLAVAAYLLLRPTIAGQNDQQRAQPGATPGQQPNSPQFTTQPVITEEMIRKAAADPALAATVPGLLFTADEWNWYGEQLTGRPGPDPLSFLTVPRDTKLTAVQYWQMRKDKGLAGLRLWR